MPRKPEGQKPLTPAERQARQRSRKASREAAMRQALEQILAAQTKREMLQIAAAALSQ